MQPYRAAVRLVAALMLSVSVLAFTVSQAAAAPAAPKNVLAGARGSMSIGVNWVPAEGALGYRVYRSQDGTGYTPVATLTGELTTHYADSGLASSTSYSYAVSALDSSGESPQSTVTPYSRATTAAPGPPRGVIVTGGDGQVMIAWNANPESNLTGYNVYRSSSSGGAAAKVNAAPVTASAYTDSTVANYLDYYYRITAVDSSGLEGVSSPERWAKPEAAQTGYVPHVRYTVEALECRTCHRTHKATGSRLLTKTREVDVCYTCHNGSGSRFTVSQEFGGPSPSRHPVPSGSNNGTMTCSDCHNPHLDYAAVDAQGNRLYPKLLEVTRNGVKRQGNEICYSCHGTGSTSIGGDHETGFDASSHNVSTAAPPSGSAIKCRNCHQPHVAPNARLTVYKEENSCLQCHYADSSTSANPDIWSSLHAGPDADSRHDILDADQAQSGAKVECINCHNGHADTAANKTVNPDRPGPGNQWTGTVSQMCEVCHDGGFPTSAQTAPYATGVVGGSRSLINVNQAYHMGIGGTAPDQHGDGLAGANILLDPAMGWQRGDVVPCDACHEPHGSPNPWNLRSTVLSKDGSRRKDGLVVLKLPGGGADTRFFCNACHGRLNMGNSEPWPSNCIGCHTHGSGRF